MMQKVSLSLIILTYNEEQHILRAIESAAKFSTSIFVVDSFSTDKTCGIAREAGAIVVEHVFVSQAHQMQWALHNLPITTDWVMRLDADEFVEDELATEISAKLPLLGLDVNGVILKRKHVFQGTWIRFGGRFPLKLLRIWRRGTGFVEPRWMDEHMFVEGGNVQLFENCFVDHNLGNLTYFVDKHNKYATRMAVDALMIKYQLYPSKIMKVGARSSVQAIFKRWLKDRVFDRLPYQFSAVFYFVIRYFFQLGFLDGANGLIYHAMQGGWYRFLIGAKIEEIEHELKITMTKSEMLEHIRKMSGLSVCWDQRASCS